MRVGIYCNQTSKKFLSIEKELLQYFSKSEICYTVFNGIEEIRDVDVVIVLGGDGTILRVSVAAGRQGIRILGINAGTLGFLTEFEGEQANAAFELLTNGFSVEKRSVLEISVNGSTHYALNDAVFQRRYDGITDSNVVAITAEIDGKKVDDFVGDGIIVSTPTGSTAYSLSAGGSILTPNIEAFCLTPVCAHSLHNRPIVYADTSVMQVKLSQEGQVVLYCDGAFTDSLGPKDRVILKKADFCVEFVKNKDSNFFDRLLFKLNKWSI